MGLLGESSALKDLHMSDFSRYSSDSPSLKCTSVQKDITSSKFVEGSEMYHGSTALGSEKTRGLNQSLVDAIHLQSEAGTLMMHVALHSIFQRLHVHFSICPWSSTLLSSPGFKILQCTLIHQATGS